MGLDIYIEDEGTEIWHGAYSAFMRFRQYIARMAGFCLDAMWGYAQSINFNEDPPWACPFRSYHKNWDYSSKQVEMKENYEPIQFPPKEEEPLVILLDHSDCGGVFEIEDLKPLADRLTQLYNRMEDENLGGHVGDIKSTTKKFIDGLYKAHDLKKKVVFC